MRLFGFGESRQRFCKRIGLAAHSKLRQLDRQHIEILVYTTCKSKAAFKTKNGHGLDLDKFSYLKRARFVGQKDDDGNPIEENFVELEDAFRRSLEGNYIKSIYVVFLRELKSPIAQLLYTHLSHLFNELNGRPYKDPDYIWLAERMGLKVYDELKRARQQFKQLTALRAFFFLGCLRPYAKKLSEEAAGTKNDEPPQELSIFLFNGQLATGNQGQRTNQATFKGNLPPLMVYGTISHYGQSNSAPRLQTYFQKWGNASNCHLDSSRSNQTLSPCFEVQT